jgi:CrcB protein
LTLLGVTLAGAVGAVARYVVEGGVQDRVEGIFPWGTFVINATGSLVLGFVVGLGLFHGLADVPRAVLGAGFCGGYTTFSTFSYETIRLVEEGARFTALTNVLGSAATTLLAAGLGLALASAF